MSWRDAPVIDEEERLAAPRWQQAPVVDTDGSDVARDTGSTPRWMSAPVITDAGTDEENRARVAQLRQEAGQPPVYVDREGIGRISQQTGPSMRAADDSPEELLKFARKEVAENWTAQGAAAGAEFVAPIGRFFGMGKTSDFLNRFSDAFHQALAERDEKNFGPVGATVMRGVRGAAEVMPTMTVAGAIAGPAGAIGVIAEQAADRALTHGKDAGLDGADLRRYVINEGLVNAIPYAVAQKFGLGGLISALSGQGGTAVAKGLLAGLKSAGIATAEQIPPAVVAAISQSVNSAISGVDPTAVEPGKLIEVAKDASVQALIMGGVVSAAHVTSRALAHTWVSANPEQAVKLAEYKGDVSRTIAEKLDIPEEVRNKKVDRNEFKEAVKQHQLELEFKKPTEPRVSSEEFTKDFKATSRPAVKVSDGKIFEADNKGHHLDALASAKESGYSADDIIETGWTYKGEFLNEQDVMQGRRGESWPTSESVQEQPSSPEAFIDLAKKKGLIKKQPETAIESSENTVLQKLSKITKEEFASEFFVRGTSNFPSGIAKEPSGGLAASAVNTIGEHWRGSQPAVYSSGGTVHIFRRSQMDIPPGGYVYSDYRPKAGEKPILSIPRSELGTDDPYTYLSKQSSVRQQQQGFVTPEKPLTGITAKLSATKDFIEDSAGRIGISTEAVSRGIGFTKHAMRRFLTSKGELPIEVYDKKIVRDGDISRVQKEMSFFVKDYDNAIRAVFGKRELTADEITGIDNALKGQVPLDNLPEPLREPVGNMRNHIDALSSALIGSGAVQGKMELTVDKNLGSYVTRSYMAFDDPAWSRKVPAAIRNKAESFLRQEYPGKSEPEIQGLIKSILFEGKAAETPIALLSQSKLGAKDLSILIRRQDIPPEIRALLGEYKDPRANYARSVTKLGSLIANHLFLTDVKQTGLGTFFSETPIVNQHGELKTRIAADESSVMNPLNGLYTTPEIKTAFERATGKEQNAAWVQLALRLNGAVKGAKTVFSAMTHVRNTIGNAGFAIANGHWQIGSMKNAWNGTLTGLLKLSNEQYRSYYLRAVELGIVGQDVHAGELRDYIKDASLQDVGSYLTGAEARRARSTKKAIKTTVETMADLYQAEDDLWKLYAWENEKARYKKAMPERSSEEIEEHTARIVSNTYPTYARIPEAVKILRKIPIIAPFISFPSEVIRCTYHTLELAKQELSDHRLRSIGATRIAGTILALSATQAIGVATRFLTGVSKNDDDDLRHFVPPWQKNSTFAHLGRTDNGDFRYVDLAYSDPHNTLITPLKAFLSGKDMKAGIWNGLKDIAEPFTNEEILFKALTESWRNHTGTGGRVYNPEETVDQQAKDISVHIWKAFEPGTLTSFRRIAKGVAGTKEPSGRTYNPSIEVLAVATGQRIQDLDIRQSLAYRVKDFVASVRDADKILLQPLTSRGNVSSKELQNAYQRTNESRKVIYKTMSDTVQAAVRLGVDIKEVRHILQSNGVAKQDIGKILAGIYIKPRITKSRLTMMRSANPQEAPERKLALQSAYTQEE